MTKAYLSKECFVEIKKHIDIYLVGRLVHIALSVLGCALFKLDGRSGIVGMLLHIDLSVLGCALFKLDELVEVGSLPTS